MRASRSTGVGVRRVHSVENVEVSEPTRPGADPSARAGFRDVLGAAIPAVRLFVRGS